MIQWNQLILNLCHCASAGLNSFLSETIIHRINKSNQAANRSQSFLTWQMYKTQLMYFIATPTWLLSNFFNEGYNEVDFMYSYIHSRHIFLV